MLCDSRISRRGAVTAQTNALTGTPNAVAEQGAEWRHQGLQHAVLGNLSTLPPSLRRGMVASLPFTRILRRLRKL
jgi:phthiodiolone/phenolphthiodiolone dimycocerosates ketoreductase